MCVYVCTEFTESSFPVYCEFLQTQETLDPTDPMPQISPPAMTTCCALVYHLEGFSLLLPYTPSCKLLQRTVAPVYDL